MELLFTGPEGPPGRSAVSQASFIQPCPLPIRVLSWTHCRLKTQVTSRGGAGEAEAPPLVMLCPHLAGQGPDSHTRPLGTRMPDLNKSGSPSQSESPWDMNPKDVMSPELLAMVT